MRRKFHQGFPYQYEILDCIDGFDFRDPNLATFYDVEHVVRDLSDCLNNVADMQLMAKMLQRHQMLDPLTCYQDVQVLDKFAKLVFSGRVVLRKPKQDKVMLTALRSRAKAKEAKPAEQEKTEPKTSWIEIWLTNGPEVPLPEEPYILRLADGEIVEGELDADGHVLHDDLKPGKLTIEFPGLFNVCEMSGRRQLSGPDRAKPRRPRKFRPPRDVSWTPELGDDSDNDDFEEADFLDDDESPLAFASNHDRLDTDEDEQKAADLPPDIDPDFAEPRPDAPDDIEFAPTAPRRAEPETYSVSRFPASTGGEYHYAILFCISVRLLRNENGDWYREPVEYEIKNPNGESLTPGTSENGIIFYDGVSSEHHELVIGNRSFQVSPCPDAWDYEEIYLDSENEA